MAGQGGSPPAAEIREVFPEARLLRRLSTDMTKPLPKKSPGFISEEGFYGKAGPDVSAAESCSC